MLVGVGATSLAFVTDFDLIVLGGLGSELPDLEEPGRVPRGLEPGLGPGLEPGRALGLEVFFLIKMSQLK